MVCKEDAQLHLSDQSTGKLKLGEIVDVRSIKRPLLWVPDLNGWVHERDVAPLGSVVTRVIQLSPKKDLDRKHPLYYDHPHHKGIWNTIDEVNGIKFWNEDATVRNISVTIDQAQGESAQLTMVNHWLSPDGSPLVKETTKLRFMADHSLVADIDFAAVDKAVTFGDTKEGLFAIRLPNSMRENAGGGPVANADGLTSTMNCWGKTSPWVDYAGPVGHRKLAVTLMDWSGAFRKSRYHVRDYGLFSINPFGPKSYTNGPSRKLQSRLNRGSRFSCGTESACGSLWTIRERPRPTSGLKWSSRTVFPGRPPRGPFVSLQDWYFGRWMLRRVGLESPTYSSR